MSRDNYIIIDTETGGLDPKTSDLLSIGMVFVRGGEVIAEREWFVKKDFYRVTPGAMRINRFDWKNITDKGKDISNIIFEFMNDMVNIFNCEGQIKPTVIGHNVDFDLSFIFEQFVDKVEWEKLVSYRKIDTAGIGRFLMDCDIIPGNMADLSSIAKKFEIDTDEDGNRHSALFDAKLTWKVYKAMRKKLGKEVEEGFWRL
ncbi:MAG: 3'-5' exonuclease [Cetobacterium sp.]|uniref:3'-5' exonuclease n=1 Tax=Cetobacterium sp. TaxID=2071632 RepID=UPI003EE6DC03